jgi:hypothetical protein
MTSQSVDLDALPLRFNPPDGWRVPDPQWVSLFQGFEPPADWEPYPGAPAIPPSWPWWEENGTSWFRFFRDRAPIPARALGNWFSLAALGLFLFAVSPFALPGWSIAFGGILGITFIVLGIRGVSRTLKTQSGPPLEPLDAIRHWSATRREEYFRDRYNAFRASDPHEISVRDFTDRLIARWWGETGEVAES